MKIEVDLNDILGDENGVETLQESVRRQVIEALTRNIREGVQKQITTETARVINEELQAAIRERMPAIVDDLLNAEYRSVDRWGDQAKEPTTFRAELVKAIHEQMVYKPARYENEKSTFTKAVDAVVGAKMEEFRAAYIRQVDAQFVADAMKYASDKLTERLGIKK